MSTCRHLGSPQLKSQNGAMLSSTSWRSFFLQPLDQTVTSPPATILGGNPPNPVVSISFQHPPLHHLATLNPPRRHLSRLQPLHPEQPPPSRYALELLSHRHCIYVCIWHLARLPARLIDPTSTPWQHVQGHLYVTDLSTTTHAPKRVCNDTLGCPWAIKQGTDITIQLSASASSRLACLLREGAYLQPKLSLHSVGIPQPYPNAK